MPFHADWRGYDPAIRGCAPRCRRRRLRRSDVGPARLAGGQAALPANRLRSVLVDAEPVDLHLLTGLRFGQFVEEGTVDLSALPVRRPAPLAARFLDHHPEL